MASPLIILATLPGRLIANTSVSLSFDVPVVPGADEARQWAQEELANKVYQDAKPGLAEQIGALIKSALDELFNNVSAPNGNIALAIAVGVVLLAIAAIIVIIRPRLNRRSATPENVFEGGLMLSAEQHRAMARAAAASGDFHTAVSEQFRAMVRAAEERDVSLPAVGRTAMEIAVELERAFPAHGEALHHSAEIFNAVRYGHAPPTPAMYGHLMATDQAVAASKPRYAADSLAVQS
ncbi:protein of unknown function [Arthrobacter alpinus]|uniref:Protein-glutamine gamma-glutamyltransferase-like C-terminal domain-containing protein n=1 Tax=Arthrobacter alpinus TaxID=656366 RepID=A0A1H5E442_9MICC|nr:DUF4129 domain-containing protein [Arthrobacter alpinus]SED85823.1 protein of unknown function [Arthrobacter alpinus]